MEQHLIEHLRVTLGLNILGYQPVGGGDINHAARLQGADGQVLFLKYNPHPQAASMLRTEAQGLQLLQEAQCIKIPDVLDQGQTEGGIAYLLLEYIERGTSNAQFWTIFGHALAQLHHQSKAQFGLDEANFIGSLPQSNHWHSTWASFYATERLLPQMHLARDQGRLDQRAAQQLDQLCQRLPELCPQEPPALIHGDLWSGNFLVDTQQHPVLIDPSVAFAHREMDLAMSRLFGGFDARFYQAYQEAWPLEPGFEDRLELYQLYYLLVHVNLFGGGYVSSVEEILQRFA